VAGTIGPGGARHYTLPEKTHPEGVIYCPVVRLSVASRLFNSLLAVLLGAGICIASGVAAELPHGEDVRARTSAEAYLREKVALWQERLKLQDWSVSLVVCQQSDLRPGTLGNIHWDADKKTAVIRVLGGSDGQTPSPAALLDMECTVIHELIHLELASLPKTDASRSAEELAVNRLAEALLALDRKDAAASATH
jgi:hypothetical protein